MSDTLVVFTMEPPELILSQGGTKEWKVRDWRAKQCIYVICVQNQFGRYRDWTCRPTRPHGSAFLIGRIADVVSTGGDRYLIKISEYSPINVPNFWPGGQMPVRYMSLAEIGVDPSGLDFAPIDNASLSSEANVTQPAASAEMKSKVCPLSLAEAKQGLTATFGVSPEAIEITIRG